jgi:DNA-binding HxlR family transcriptional regulator
MSRCRRCAPLPEEVRRAADLLERRWLLSIVYAAHSGAVRFNEFRQVLGSIPPRTLAARLRELEQAGVLERTVVDARPPTVEYHLTAEGQRLRSIVDALRTWAVTRPTV